MEEESWNQNRNDPNISVGTSFNSFLGIIPVILPTISFDLNKFTSGQWFFNVFNFFTDYLHVNSFFTIKSEVKNFQVVSVPVYQKELYEDKVYETDYESPYQPEYLKSVSTREELKVSYVQGLNPYNYYD